MSDTQNITRTPLYKRQLIWHSFACEPGPEQNLSGYDEALRIILDDAAFTPDTVAQSRRRHHHTHEPDFKKIFNLTPTDLGFIISPETNLMPLLEREGWNPKHEWLDLAGLSIPVIQLTATDYKSARICATGSRLHNPQIQGFTSGLTLEMPHCVITNGSKGHYLPTYPQRPSFKDSTIKANFSNGNLSYPIISNCEFHDSTFQHVPIGHGNIEMSHFINCDFSKANITNSQFTFTHFERCDFNGLSCAATKFTDCDFTHIKGWQSMSFNSHCSFQDCTFPEGMEKRIVNFGCTVTKSFKTAQQPAASPIPKPEATQHLLDNYRKADARQREYVGESAVIRGTDFPNKLKPVKAKPAVSRRTMPYFDKELAARQAATLNIMRSADDAGGPYHNAPVPQAPPAPQKPEGKVIYTPHYGSEKLGHLPDKYTLNCLSTTAGEAISETPSGKKTPVIRKGQNGPAQGWRVVEGGKKYTEQLEQNPITEKGVGI